jgi:hypothetical protein
MIEMASRVCEENRGLLGLAIADPLQARSAFSLDAFLLAFGRREFVVSPVVYFLSLRSLFPLHFPIMPQRETQYPA